MLNTLNNLPRELKIAAKHIYETVLERSLNKAYHQLDDGQKATMDKIFESDNENDKDEFLRRYLKDLPKIMAEETDKIMREIKESAI